MSVGRLLDRATRNLRSATLLFEDHDLTGACNRAYYAVFDATKAAMLTAKTSVDVEGIKTHAGLIQAFGLHLVKTGKVSTELGRILGRLEQTRILADYADNDVNVDQAAGAIRKAAEFVAAMRKLIAQAG